jgi:hypothetical protein
MVPYGGSQSWAFYDLSSRVLAIQIGNRIGAIARTDADGVDSKACSEVSEGIGW